MIQQPKSLRLADELKKWAVTGSRTFDEEAMAVRAAEELLRLHASEREGWRYADELEQVRKQLTAENERLKRGH